MIRPAALLFALGAILASADARAGRTEIVVGAGIISPRASDYRYTTETLGYDRRSFRIGYEIEAGFVHAFNYWLSIGPLARVYMGKLGAPYDPVPAIETYGVSLAARFEVDLFPWPRIFLWADPSIGRGSIGIPDARMSNTFWGVRAGIGLGTAREKASVRFRFGYAYAPTTDKISPWTGPFDYGGWLFQLDGVLRVLP